MKAYDKYYLTKDLFGKPYPELMDFFKNLPSRGKLLDLGCGQGRNAVPLARLGFDVTGIDSSEVGIDQMNKIGLAEELKLKGIVQDIYKFDKYSEFDFVLLDSMFHFNKKDNQKEANFIRSMIEKSSPNTVITFCIQDSGVKVKILNETLDFQRKIERKLEAQFNYFFSDNKTGHSSKINYKMMVIKN